MVRVSLMNKGSDAYRPEDFGEHITVERRIEPTGTSSYRLLAGNPYDPVRVFTSINLTLTIFTSQENEKLANLDGRVYS